MQNFIDHLNSMIENNERDSQRKLEFLKKDIEQYDKREIMFAN